MLWPFSLLYGTISTLRNWCYDIGLFTSYDVPVVVICVGNIKAGGTGKTPFTQYLLNHYSTIYKTAVLSRGYGRKTKGFILADASSTAEKIGDEPLQLFLNSDTLYQVAVCEDRVTGVQQLLKYNPDLQLIILDDAYQHRKIKRDINILLTEFDNPFFKDQLLPGGRLREEKAGAKRADLVVVTKTRSEKQVSNFSLNKIYQYSGKTIPVFFTGIEYQNIQNINENKSLKKEDNVILITGIANPKPLCSYIESKATIIEHVSCKDHYSYSLADINKLESLLALNKDSLILTTEKDWVKIYPLIKYNPNLSNWYYLPIGIHIYAEKELLFSLIDKRITKRLNRLK